MANIEYANGKISDEEHVLLITCCRWPHHQEPTFGPNITIVGRMSLKWDGMSKFYEKLRVFDIKILYMILLYYSLYFFFCLVSILRNKIM
jgi:hypothetical protein